MNSITRLVAFLAALCFGVSATASDTDAEALVEMIVQKIKTDERSPTDENVSGSWTINPEIKGPSYHLFLTQTDDQISGEGIFEGGMGGTRPYKIEGTILNGVLDLTFHGTRRTKKVTFNLVDYHGFPALARDELYEYPLVPYIERLKLKEKLKTQMKIEPNKSVDSTPVSAPR